MYTHMLYAYLYIYLFLYIDMYVYIYICILLYLYIYIYILNILTHPCREFARCAGSSSPGACCQSTRGTPQRERPGAQDRFFREDWWKHVKQNRQWPLKNRYLFIHFLWMVFFRMVGCQYDEILDRYHLVR